MLRQLTAYLNGNATWQEGLAIASGSAPSATIGVSTSAAKSALAPIGRNAALSLGRRAAFNVVSAVSSAFGTPVTIGATLVDFACCPTDYGLPGGSAPSRPSPTAPTSSIDYLRNQNS
jgi:hypothetical protein